MLTGSTMAGLLAHAARPCELALDTRICAVGFVVADLAAVVTLSGVLAPSFSLLWTIASEVRVVSAAARLSVRMEAMKQY